MGCNGVYHKSQMVPIFRIDQMKHKLLSLLFLSLLVLMTVSCIERQASASAARCNVLDSIPGDKPVLDKKYSLDIDNFTKIVEVAFGNENRRKCVLSLR